MKRVLLLLIGLLFAIVPFLRDILKTMIKNIIMAIVNVF